jgi:hypothetical protein
MAISRRMTIELAAGQKKSGEPVREVADPDRKERVSGYRLLRTVSTRSSWAAASVRIATRSGATRRFVLLWHGTRRWAAVEVKTNLRRLGCGLVPSVKRKSIGLSLDCG